jgi:hypothetical protein
MNFDLFFFPFYPPKLYCLFFSSLGFFKKPYKNKAKQRKKKETKPKGKHAQKKTRVFPSSCRRILSLSDGGGARLFPLPLLAAAILFFSPSSSSLCSFFLRFFFIFVFWCDGATISRWLA